MNNVEIILAQDKNGDFFQDIKINSPLANVNDVIKAFERFCEEKTASCYGCVGCCQERVPVTCFDAEKLLPLLPAGEQTLANLCQTFLYIEILPDGAVDIQLKRNKDGSCFFMNAEKSCCNIHPYRTFACATHYCLPRSNAINDIRSAVINYGMDELVRRLLQEGVLEHVNIDDYAENMFSGKKGYEQILLSDLLNQYVFKTDAQ